MWFSLYARNQKSHFLIQNRLFSSLVQYSMHATGLCFWLCIWFLSPNVAGGRKGNSMIWCLMYDVSAERYTENFKATQQLDSICGIELMSPWEMDHCCWDLNIHVSMGSFSSCQSKNTPLFFLKGEKNHTDSTCSQENGRTSLFMHFFLLCIRLTVLRSIYLTSHAYVGGQEGKEFGESSKGSCNLIYELF